MVRFVRSSEGWLPDRERRQEGRGAYLCSPACAGRVEKNKRFSGLASAARRVFEENVPTGQRHEVK
jgi:predicted RNA-binding protein YlxR (DUF448 family)